MKSIILITGLLWLTALWSCRRDVDPQLPPATQAGKNTFGCLINGKVFVPGGNQPLFKVSLFITLDDSTLDIHADYNRAQRYVGIFRKQVFQIGDYDLRSKTTVLNYWNDDQIGSCQQYYNGGSSPSASVLEGTLTITRLSSGGIVAGLFEFTLVSPQCDTVRVTQGRFDYQR